MKLPVLLGLNDSCVRSQGTVRESGKQGFYNVSFTAFPHLWGPLSSVFWWGYPCILWRHDGLVVSALNFQTEVSGPSMVSAIVLFP